MRWARALQTSLLLWVLTVMVVGTAAAQSRSYRRVIREAVSEFDAGNYGEARALFREAHELRPSARTLRGIGKCLFELRDYGEAIRVLGESLTDERSRLTPRQRREVEGLIQRAEGFIGRFFVTTVPAGASIRVDDAPAEPNALGELVLNLGEHLLEVSSEGFEPEQLRVEVRGGEVRELPFELEPVATASPSPTVPTGPLTLVVGAGVLLVVAGLSMAWTLDRVDELNICLNPGEGFRCTNRDTLLAQRDASVASMLSSTILAVVMGLGGGLWWFFEENARNESSDAEVSVRCGPSTPGVVCEGRF